ncbi:transcription antitermination protein NusB [Candidatus Gracilibacteria bacterium]|nr:transcription antitermination protein NusB [Candidatus Gracilibacteria bacterium]
MQKNRSRSRGFLFQKLYSQCYNTLNKDDFRESFYEGRFTFAIDGEYIDEMIDIINKHEPFFIHIIQKYSPKFKISQMSVLYIIPVYIGLAEMFFLSEEIPAKVSINEAIEIAKMYGDDSAKKIVNGVLNNALQDYNDLKKQSNQEIKKDETIFLK